ncbi:MAG: hypothetical protein JSS07_03865 [Proteobacteria bacterium]|nr:hypothetical protein [Pseudomonadota bacterium]
MVQRKENGQFMAGKSGNPSGRPSTEITAIRKELAAHSKAIIQVVKNAALGGDMQACKMILDRICPPFKPQAAPVVISLPPGSDFTQIAEALIKASAEGLLPPDIGAQMVASIGQLARIAVIKENLPQPENDEDILRHIRISIIGEDGIERDMDPVTRALKEPEAS